MLSSVKTSRENPFDGNAGKQPSKDFEEKLQAEMDQIVRNRGSCL
jgi:hypothetical protein